MVDVASTTIVRKTVFDPKDFYVFLWNVMCNKLSYSFNEDDYSHWKKDYGTDIEFHWTFKRNMDSYTQLKIWMECKMRGLNKVKVKEGDDTVSKQSGEIELGMKAVILTDREGKWSKHWLLKHFKNRYEKTIYKELFDGYFMRLWEHLFYVESEVKSYFNIPKF
ncbi:MAG: hypothetical protein WC307_01745 [Candidatus Nanoarchaeia archaeon]|jgi:hypothetical protein